MTRGKNGTTVPARNAVRCAIYTRKSTEEGLQQEFNSLDAQRESAEAYIKSQAAEGWTCLPDRYNDGGFTGGNMDRPALQRLMADIAAGKVDAVVVYKIDRLSRSLLDFARMMDVFEQRQVSFVSVTQQFNTATSMGRLILNVLLSFAQFEREIIAERTRDKIAATRRKGKWSGGRPLLGYDLDPQVSRLLVNEEEAVRVRAIFEMYLKFQGLLPVVEELARRGWTNKRWRARKGHECGGRPFNKNTLYQVLTNVTFAGQVKYKGEIHPGEQPAIIDPVTWQRVQAMLQRNGRAGGSAAPNKFGALLRGLLHCVPCGCSMTPAHANKKGRKRYRYYVCCAAQKKGWRQCPSKSIPAGEIERFVVEQIRCVGRDPGLLGEVLAQARSQGRKQAAEMEGERRGLERQLARWNSEVRPLLEQVGPGQTDGPALARLADLQERIRQAEDRLREIRDLLDGLDRDQVDETEAARALSLFDPIWETLTPQEQTRVIQLLIERVDYDGARGKVRITFYPTGIKTLAEELANQSKEKSA